MQFIPYSSLSRTVNALPAAVPITAAHRWAIVLISRWSRWARWKSSTPRPRPTPHRVVSTFMFFCSVNRLGISELHIMLSCYEGAALEVSKKVIFFLLFWNLQPITSKLDLTATNWCRRPILASGNADAFLLTEIVRNSFLASLLERPQKWLAFIRHSSSLHDPTLKFIIPQLFAHSICVYRSSVICANEWKRRVLVCIVCSSNYISH